MPFSYTVTFVILTVDNIPKYLMKNNKFSDIYERYPQTQKPVRYYKHLKDEQTF